MTEKSCNFHTFLYISFYSSYTALSLTYQLKSHDNVIVILKGQDVVDRRAFATGHDTTFDLHVGKATSLARWWPFFHAGFVPEIFFHFVAVLKQENCFYNGNSVNLVKV